MPLANVMAINVKAANKTPQAVGDRIPNPAPFVFKWIAKVVEIPLIMDASAAREGALDQYKPATIGTSSATVSIP